MLSFLSVIKVEASSSETLTKVEEDTGKQIAVLEVL